MNLKLKRVKMSLTQEQLSLISGVSRSVISKIEKGKIEGIKIGTLKKLANALDTTVQELFFSEEEL